MDEEIEDSVRHGEELIHYGVLGMRWGVSRSEAQLKRSRKNKDYSDQQRKRDRQIYGRGGERRVNKKMNKGDRVSVARGSEKTRRDRVMGKNKYARQAGKVTGAVTSIVAGNVALVGLSKLAQSKTGMQIVGKMLGVGKFGGIGYAKGVYNSMQLAGAISSMPGVKLAVSIGAAKVGAMMAGDAGVAINMRSKGYDQNRK